MSVYIFACLYPKLYKNITEKSYVIISLLQSLLKHYLANTANSQSIDYSNCDIKQNWTRKKIIL